MKLKRSKICLERSLILFCGSAEKRALTVLSTGTCTGNGTSPSFMVWFHKRPSLMKSASCTVKASIEQVEKQQFPAMIVKIEALASTASAHPYYKFNHMWSRQMQDAVCEKVPVLVSLVCSQVLKWPCAKFRRLR